MTDLSAIPQIVCITNLSDVEQPVVIPYISDAFILGPGSMIRLLAKSSPELMGYLMQDSPELQVVFHIEGDQTGFILDSKSGNFVINKNTGNFVIVENC